MFFVITVLGWKVGTMKSLQQLIEELVPQQVWKWTQRNHYRYQPQCYVRDTNPLKTVRKIKLGV